MKYYIIAGEASGDLHGASLIEELIRKDPEAHIRAWGGDRMESAGAELVKHYRELDYMGFWEIIVNLPTILSNLRSCKKDIRSFEPDALILIDYPGFNLRIAKWARKRSMKVFYYISPQLWAWKEGRVKTIDRSVDRMFVILPFEQSFYAGHKIDVTYVGHPLLDVIENYKLREERIASYGASEKDIIALLPGSRKQEIKRILPQLLKAVSDRTDCLLLLAAVPHHSESFYRDIMDRNPVQAPLELITDRTYDILSVADAALVASGTASLEAALFEVPECVVYKGNPISYFIAKYLVKVDYISLVNLILDRPLITELIQGEVTPSTIRRELSELFLEHRRKNILEGYEELKNLLGKSGAAKLVAAEITQRLQS